MSARTPPVVRRARIGRWRVATVRLAAAIGSALVAGTVHAADGAARIDALVQAQCAFCHGLDGENATPAFPRLAAQNADYVASQLAAFRSGARRNAVMQGVAAQLDPKDFAAIGAWFAARPAQAHPGADPGLAFAGKALWNGGNVPAGVPACMTCHGADGHGGPLVPRLAGQHPEYVVRQLKQFGTRSKTPDNASMHLIAQRLTDAEMKAVAAFVAGLR
ncbi:MAG: c-type cytochrome [Burkholderiales bacterium]|jgi:cytochrome c553